jgi:hypothetical protein
MNKTSGTLKFNIHGGNNSKVVRRVMEKRLALESNAAAEEAVVDETQWEEVSFSHLFNFKWKPTS